MIHSDFERGFIKAETTGYDSANPTPLPPSPAKPRTSPQRDRNPQAEKPFDWTPILLVVIAVLSGLVGYFLFMR